MLQFLGVKTVRHGLSNWKSRREEAHKALGKSKVERTMLDRCLEQYDEVSGRPLDKTIESAISRSKTLSIGPAVKGIRVLLKTKGDLTDAGDDATISVPSLYGEVLKQDSRAQYQALGLRAAIFFSIYATAVVLQRNASTEAFAAEGIKAYFAKTRFASPATPSREWPSAKFQACSDNSTYPKPIKGSCTTVAYKMLGFFDIKSIDDFWDWLPNHFVPMWYENQQGDSLQKFKVADGFRLVLRRGFADTECVNRFVGAIRAFADPFCYDRLRQCSSRECILGQDDNRRPYGIMANRSRYYFQSFDLPSGGYEGGYFQFFPVSDKQKGRDQVARLKKDRWMDSDAQWARLDFPLFNSDESLIIDFRMYLDIDPTGKVSPFVLVDMYRATWYDFSKYEDIVRLVLELLTVFFWVMQIYDAVRDLLRCRARHINLSRDEKWNRYINSPYHSPVRNMQVLLFLFIFALWLAVIADPLRSGIAVNSVSIQSDGGRPLFTTQSGKIVRAYFLLNGFNCLLFSFRLLACSKMHPNIAELCAALGMQLPILSWFATVLFIVMLLFSFQVDAFLQRQNTCLYFMTCELQAIVMFGQSVLTCADFGGALASTTQMSWSRAANARSFYSQLPESVLAVSQRKGVGYLDLRAVAPTTAWLYYYPLFIVTWLFLVLATIPFIVDGYHSVRNNRKLAKNPKKKIGADNLQSAESVHIFSRISKFISGKIISQNHEKNNNKNMEQRNLARDDILQFCEGLPEDVNTTCTSLRELKTCAQIQGFPKSFIDKIVKSYPFVLNQIEDLEHFIIERVPPSSKTNANAGIVDGEELLEQFANIQVRFPEKMA